MMNESPNQRIAIVVAWIKQNFMHNMHVDELANKANMSPSAFRQHFRAATTMSPLQFQKQLRLQEARQLMLNKGMDVSCAARAVGYESPSQFSREYSRFFYISPQRDIQNKRK